MYGHERHLAGCGGVEGEGDRGLGGGFDPDGHRDVVAAQRRWLADQVQLWRDKYPDLVIHEIVRMHQPAATLLDAAVGAALLVVGSRRRKQLRGLVLGSVGLALLHHATCPVAVVPPDCDGACPVGDELEDLHGDPHR